MSERIVYVLVEPITSRVLGVYSDEEKARNRISELIANKNIHEANICRCELDKDIEIAGKWVTKETLKNDKVTETQLKENIRKMKEDMREFFENLPK